MTSDESTRTAPIAPRRRRLRLWLAPLIVVSALMSLLGVLYLDSLLNPQKSMHDFPIALVNMDVGDNLGPSDGVSGRASAAQRVDFGKQVADGLIAGIPADKVDLRVVGIAEAERQLQLGKAYGAIVIPGDFSKRLAILGAGGVVPGDMERPIITVRTNPRVGAYATAMMTQVADLALTKANQSIGTQLSAQVAEQTRGATLAGAAKLTLAQPINIVTAPFHPLPDGTGNGLSAFFFSLLVMLAGFTGAMIVNTTTDATLGFVPNEIGPRYLHFPAANLSRFQTLLLKWAIMTVVAFVVSGLYLLIGRALGMPLQFGLALYLYTAFAIAAVGVTALSILATLGNMGLLVNLILFIVLGLPSSGGTVPIEASPPFYSWLAQFEPFHQVFTGIRSILYFDASADAGLAHAFWMTLLGLAIGLALGIVATRFYDRRGLHRKP